MGKEIYVGTACFFCVTESQSLSNCRVCVCVFSSTRGLDPKEKRKETWPHIFRFRFFLVGQKKETQKHTTPRRKAAHIVLGGAKKETEIAFLAVRVPAQKKSDCNNHRRTQNGQKRKKHFLTHLSNSKNETKQNDPLSFCTQKQVQKYWCVCQNFFFINCLLLISVRKSHSTPMTRSFQVGKNYFIFAHGSVIFLNVLFWIKISSCPNIGISALVDHLGQAVIKINISLAQKKKRRKIESATESGTSNFIMQRKFKWTIRPVCCLS